MTLAVLNYQLAAESFSKPNVKLVESGVSSGPGSLLDFATKDTSDMTNPGREEIDAKLNATEARVEATVVRLESKVDASLAKMDASLAKMDARIESQGMKLDSAMARMDARIDTLGMKLDSAVAVMNAKLDHLPSTWVLVTTVFGAFVATIAAVIGILSFGGDRFDSGSQIATQIMETRSLSDENARQIKDVSERLDALPDKLLDAIEKRNRGDQVPGNDDAQ